MYVSENDNDSDSDSDNESEREREKEEQSRRRTSLQTGQLAAQSAVKKVCVLGEGGRGRGSEGVRE